MTSGITSSSNLNLVSLQAAQGFSISDIGSNSGYSVTGAGDTNDDGIDDIIIGVPNVNKDAGISYVVYGSTILNDIELSSITSSQGFSISGIDGSGSGYSVAGAGDVNADGIDDIIIGGPYANNDVGISYIVYGSTTLNNINLAHITSLQGFSISGAAGQSGASVAGAGDVNNDGYDDIIIGAPYATNYKLVPSNIESAGISYVIYGGVALNNIDLSHINPSQGFSISGTLANSYSGWLVAGAGDVNGDGINDIMIGAPGTNIVPSMSYVIYGGTALNDIDLSNIISSQGFSIFGIGGSISGYSVAGAGDMNNDGVDDIIIGAPDANKNAGISYVIYGGTALNNIDLSNIYPSQGFSISGTVDSKSGAFVAGAGDVNGDGIDDIIIGAPGANNDAGISCVIYGNTTINNIDLSNITSSQGFFISGTVGSESGFLVAGAGDINDDGIDDIIVDEVVGIAYVVYGATTGFKLPVPTTFPSGSPTSQPTTSHPTSFPSGIPSSQPSAQPTSQPSAQPTSKPTKAPTPMPSPIPTEQAVVVNNNYNDAQTSVVDSLPFKAGLSAASFVVSLISGWLLRNKVAFYILDNWGHKYKLIYNYNSQAPLKDNEIGLYLNEDRLTCIVKGKEFLCPIGDNNHGISQNLHEVITQALKTPDGLEEFNLLAYEKNQLRDFLIANKYIAAEKTYCLLKSFKELGYIKGTIYNAFLSKFELEYGKTTKKHIRLEIDKQISMQTFSSNLPQEEDSNIYTNNPMAEQNSKDPKTINNDVDNQIDTVLSVDSLMDIEHVKLQEKAFLKFSNQLTYVAQGVTDSHSKLLSIDNSIFSSSNIDYFPIAQFTQNALELSSAIRYFAKLLGVDLPQFNLPNEFWAGVHFAAGIVKIGGDTALSVGQMIESGSYYARLELYDMLAEANTDKKLTDLMSFAQACSKHIAIGGVLGLASAAPVYGTINGAAICLNQHQMLTETDTQTAMRYAIDAVAAVAAMYGLADQDVLTQAMGIVSAVSMSDIAAKVGITTAELGMNEIYNWCSYYNYIFEEA